MGPLTGLPSCTQIGGGHPTLAAASCSFRKPKFPSTSLLWSTCSTSLLQCLNASGMMRSESMCLWVMVRRYAASIHARFSMRSNHMQLNSNRTPNLDLLVEISSDTYRFNGCSERPRKKKWCNLTHLGTALFPSAAAVWARHHAPRDEPQWAGGQMWRPTP